MASHSKNRPAHATLSKNLKGRVSAPSNKSISHRAIILGGTAIGETRITGLLESEDVMSTIAAMRAMGASIEKDGDEWFAFGRGCGGLVEPDIVLDMGNSGTSTRLLMGLMATNSAIVACLCLLHSFIGHGPASSSASSMGG